jgi:hypothetical protein
VIGPHQCLDQSAYRPEHGLYVWTPSLGHILQVRSGFTYDHCLRNRLGDKSGICSVGKGMQPLY